MKYTRVNGQVTCACTNGDDVLKLTELTDISIGANIAALLFGLWLGFLLLAYVAPVKTSFSPSGTSPRHELFVPTMAVAGAVQPLPQNELSLPRQQLGQVSSVAHT